jgi:phospholipase/lecithinase/hemolysin
VRILDMQFPGAAGAADLIAQAYNLNLAGVVQLLGNMLPGVDIRVLNIYATLNSVASNPAAFGFVDVTHACVTPGAPPFACKKPDTFAYWDGTHPTKALHAIVAQQAIAVVSAP